MAEVFAWFEKSRKKSFDRSWRDRHRLLLSLEILEPRQMLAADGLGGFVPLVTAENACEQVCDGVALFPHWNQEQGPCCDESDGSVERDEPKQVYLEEMAKDVGELFEIDDRDTWWLEGD